MKQILYFLIGFCIPFIWFSISYATVDCIGALAGDADIVSAYDNSDDARDACYSASPTNYCTQGAQWNSDYTALYHGWTYDPNDGTSSSDWPFFPYNEGDIVFSCSPAGSVPDDTDEDGIPDGFDLKPDSSESYKAAIVSVCYDENNKVVAGVIQDGEGNQYSFGTMPTDFEGYTIESVTGDLVTYQTAEDFAASLEKLDIDDLNITKQNSPVEIQDDGTIIPGSTDPFEDYKKAEDDQTQAKKPETQQAPSEQPDSNDGDSDRLDKIIKNTSSTNTNLDNIQKYLGITNDYLAKINDKSGKTSSTSSGGAFVSVNTPTADEIGQAVEDNLIDSGQTIDPTTTDNIPDLDKTDKLTQMKTECSDRYDLFINTLKDSDLFTVPFSLFDGPSGNGSSVQTVDIGSWGSSTNRTVAIDYSDYDYVWSLLSSVLLIISSFLAFKILILNRG
jgi:hypothetical protein